MTEVVCPQCGLHFPSEDGRLPVCPSCHAVDGRRKQCWRCKRLFVAGDRDRITCEQCKTYWAVCSSPR